MKKVNVILPKLGESILGATIVKWLKKEGDRVDLDEPLVEVSTDKVNSEIPSPNAGILKEIIVKENVEVKVGDTIAVLSIGEEEENGLKRSNIEDNPIKQEDIKINDDNLVKKDSLEKDHSAKSSIFLSPVAKALIKEYKLTEEDLHKITPTGAGGRISKKDIENFVMNQKKVASSDQEEIISLSPLRKEIAKNMTLSKDNIPSASLIMEIDVTDILKIIKENKEKFIEKFGVKITITSFFLKAISFAIEKHPYLNAKFEEDKIFLKKNINIGLAVNVEDGLLVPVIKNCQNKNILDFSKQVFSLSSKAREKKLSIQDISDGTITLTNFGMGGAKIGIPIIRYGEAAIIGIGTITKKVVIQDNSSFTLRDIINLSLSFDHRIIDGMYACMFAGEIKNYMENFGEKDFKSIFR